MHTEADTNQNWREFLLSVGANRRDDQTLDFGDPDGERRYVRDGDVLTDLTTLAPIRAQGTDAQAFLNGQLSNDIRRVDPARGQLAAWCNSKGRVLALFQVLQRNGAFYLFLPTRQRESILVRLRQYVMRAKVTLDAPTEDVIPLGLSGPSAADTIRDWLGESPGEPYQCITHDSVTAMRLPGAPTRFLIIVDAGQACVVWDRLRSRARPVGVPCWNWLEVAAGQPQVYPETSEAFVPQMLNLDVLAGVDFKKGCYPGQEIVARLHYRGGLKQRLYSAHSLQPATPSDAIYAADLPGQACGQVVESATAPEGGYDMLVVLQTTSVVAASPLRLRSETDGPLLTLKPLPYAVVSADSSKTP